MSLFFRLGTLGLVATSFLAGSLLEGHVALGIALATSWLLLPWLEILTKVRRLRLPIDRRLEPRAPPSRSSFPGFQEMTDEIESGDLSTSKTSAGITKKTDTSTVSSINRSSEPRRASASLSSKIWLSIT